MVDGFLKICWNVTSMYGGSCEENLIVWKFPLCSHTAITAIGSDTGVFLLGLYSLEGHPQTGLRRPHADYTGST